MDGVAWRKNGMREMRKQNGDQRLIILRAVRYVSGIFIWTAVVRGRIAAVAAAGRSVAHRPPAIQSPTLFSAWPRATAAQVVEEKKLQSAEMLFCKRRG